MSVALIKLFILGKIPGMDVTFSFWTLFGVVFTLGLAILFYQMLRLAFSLRWSIDPFYGAPKELTQIDLLSL